MNNNTPDSSQINEILGGHIKPNWGAWKSIKQAKLWEAASLACDLDPSNFEINGQPIFRFFGQLPKPIEDLLDMAKANLGAGGILKLVTKGKHGWRDSEVRLSNFATWVNTVPHDLPPEFPWSPQPITFSNLNWPWGRHETDLLRKLAAAAHEFWDNYDPNEPTTAPKNDQVIGWLEQQGGVPRILPKLWQPSFAPMAYQPAPKIILNPIGASTGASYRGVSCELPQLVESIFPAACGIQSVTMFNSTNEVSTWFKPSYGFPPSKPNPAHRAQQSTCAFSKAYGPSL